MLDHHLPSHRPQNTPGTLRLHRSIVQAAVATLALSGCASLPSSGPTSAQIFSEAETPEKPVDFRLISVTDIASLPQNDPPSEVFDPDYDPQSTTTIGIGDILEIAIYETGVSLFGNAGSGASRGFDSSSSIERFPPIRVDDTGVIYLPFAGKIQAAGMTSSQLEANIRRSYDRMSQNPQVLVSIREAVGNSVIVGGEILKPGRLSLATNLETVSDVVALAGGYKGDAKDLSVRLVRRNEVVDLRLSEVMNSQAQDLRVYPGDKVSVLRVPRTYSVMGAPNRVENITFSAPSITLAEALAQAGGANPNLGDAKAVFVFRIVRDRTGKESPVVYHLNMMTASGLLLSQRFQMQDKDVLYVGNAEANQASKLVQLVSQLFSPVVAVGSVVNGLGQ